MQKMWLQPKQSPQGQSSNRANTNEDLYFTSLNNHKAAQLPHQKFMESVISLTIIEMQKWFVLAIMIGCTFIVLNHDWLYF